MLKLHMGRGQLKLYYYYYYYYVNYYPLFLTVNIGTGALVIIVLSDKKTPSAGY